MDKKEDPKQKVESVNIEDSIRHMKIKEHAETKENLQNKIKLLDENIKLLESNDFSKLKPENEIEQNIKKHKVKEIKSKREVLETKVQTIEHQIKNLLEGDHGFNNAKKIQITKFLENFERDKSVDKDKYKKWEIEREERINHFTELHKKNEDKAKEEMLRQKEELEFKKKEEHRLYLEKIQARNIENREKALKFRENLKTKVEPKQYNYERLEEEFKLKQQQMEEEKRKLEQAEKEKRRNLLQPIRKEHFEEFQKSYLEKKHELLVQKEKDRILKTEEINSENSKFLKPDSEVYKKVVQDEKNNKENEEKKKVEKIYKCLKVKNFSKVVKDNLLPRINEYKKKEIEDRINKNKIPHVHYKRKNPYNVIFKPRNPTRNKKSEGDLLRPKTTSNENENETIAYNYNTKDDIRPNSGESPIKLKQVDIRKPLDKLPDYLAEKRMKKKLDEEKEDHNLTGNLATISNYYLIK